MMLKSNKSKSPLIRFSWHQNHCSLLISEFSLLMLKYSPIKSLRISILLWEELLTRDSMMERLIFNSCNLSGIKIFLSSNLSKTKILMTESWNSSLQCLVWKKKELKPSLLSFLTFLTRSIQNKVQSSTKVMTFLLVSRLIFWSYSNQVVAIPSLH